MQLVSQNYWWRGMGQDIAAVLTSCVQCQRSEKTFARQVALKPIKVRRLNERQSADLVGPLPKSEPLGNRYILSVVEHASRHVFAYPLLDATGPRIAACLAHLWSTGPGAPEVLQTDRGSYWTSAAVQAVLKRHAVRHKESSAYHPQTNGAVERWQQSMVNSLRRACSGKHATLWEAFLAEVVLAYNSTKQTSTKLEPARVLFGYLPRLPTYAEPTQQEARALADNNPASRSPSPDLDPTESDIEARQAAQATHVETALTNLAQAQERQAREYAAKHGQPKLPTLTPGTQVLCAAHQRKHKLQDRSKGPFMFVKYAGPGRRVCLLRDRLGREWTENAEFVRPLLRSGATASRRTGQNQNVTQASPEEKPEAENSTRDGTTPAPSISAPPSQPATEGQPALLPSSPACIDLTGEDDAAPNLQEAAATAWAQPGPLRRSRRPPKPRALSPDPPDPWTQAANRIPRPPQPKRRRAQAQAAAAAHPETGRKRTSKTTCTTTAPPSKKRCRGGKCAK